MKAEINLVECYHFIMKRIWLIVVASVLGLGVATVYSLFIAVPLYESTTQLLVNQRGSVDTALNTGDMNANIQLIETYKELIKGPAILNRVKESSNAGYSLEELREKIDVDAPNNVQVFNITVTDTDPYVAAELTNIVAGIFREDIQVIMPRIDNVAVIYDAQPNLTAVSPNIKMNSLMGLIIGMFLSTGSILLLYLMNGKVRTYDFITEEIGWTNLGSIDDVKVKTETKVDATSVVMDTYPHDKKTVTNRV